MGFGTPQPQKAMAQGTDRVWRTSARPTGPLSIRPWPRGCFGAFGACQIRSGAFDAEGVKCGKLYIDAES